MKCLNTIFVGLVAILVGIIVYKVYLPLSPKLLEDTILPALFKLGDLFASVSGKLGIAPRYWIMRLIIRSMDGSEKGHFDGEGDVEDTTISGVPVRIYRSRTGLTQNNARPCFIYIHGGGLTLFSARSKIFDKMLSKFSAATGSVVMSVDYRLAPEHMFPAQFQDCYSVVSTVIAESTKFGIIKNKIVIGGDSAGGLLSAAISLEFAKEKREKDIAAQILINPWLQAIDMTCLPSYQDNRAEEFMVTREQTAYYIAIVTTGKPDMQQEYLSGNVSRYFRQTPYWKLLEIPESSNCAQIPSEKNFPEFPPQFVQTTVDQRLSPLLADTVEGVPPTFVAIAQYDLLASEGSLFARRLEKAGISVVHKIYKTYHGFIYTTTPMVTEAMHDMINYLNSAFYED